MRLRLLLIFVASLSFIQGVCFAESGRWESLANPYVFGQQLQAAIDEEGWDDVHRSLANEAYQAYKFNRASAQRLLYAFLWVDLLRRNEKEWVDNWYSLMKNARRLRPDWQWESSKSSRLADRLDTGVFQYLMGHPEWAERVYLQMERVDFIPRALEILSELYSGNKYAFERFPQVAFAIALVHDYPPPPYWPHSQVSENVLPRKLRDPLWVMNFLADRTRTSRELKLEDISLLQAIFLVDISLSDDDIEWIKKHLSLEWQNMESYYNCIAYDQARLSENRMSWPKDDYSLSEIYERGGICVDQAYFASQVSKAFGIPSLLFSGKGLSGRHAWFGYLDIHHQWFLDGGRYASQRFVTGVALNPQTWEFINDHRLQEITTGLYEERQASRAQLHLTWARSFEQMGYLEEARKAMKNATNLDRYNIDIWREVIAFRQRHEATVAEVREVYRSALYALSSRPDLESRLSKSFVSYLESVGETTAAEIERRRIMEKYKSYRSDIALQNAAETMRASLAKDNVSGQWYVYQQLMTQLEGQGIGVLDSVIKPFVKQQRIHRRLKLAQQAIELAWERLAPDADSQFARELKKL